MKAIMFMAGAFLLLTVALNAQEKEFKSATVVSFEEPFEVITVSIENVGDMALTMDSTAVVKNKKGAALRFSDLEEGNDIRIVFEIREKKRVVTKIELLTETDEGKARFNGLFEGYDGTVAFIDGRKVTLAGNAVFKGAKKGDGKMEIDFLGFEDPVLKKGYYMRVEGKMQPDGILLANEIMVRKNTSTKDDEKLIALVDQGFNDEGLKKVAPPNNTFNPANGLYNGNIEIGGMKYKLSTDIRLQGYINEVGYKLIPTYTKDPAWEKENQKIDFRFYVIDDPTLNAFAWPNGMVFIHTGLLKIIENEAQLAFVLSHEISHVLYEHGTARFRKSESLKEAMGYGKTIMNLAGKAGLDKLNPFKKKNAPVSSTTYSYEYYAMIQRLNGIGAGRSKSSQADQILSVALNSISEKLTPDALSGLFSKDQESQADRIGLYYAQLAGYDIREVPKFWNKMMEKTEDPGFMKDMVSGFKTMLKTSSATLNLSGDVSNQLLNSSADMIIDNVFKSIYMSHPLTKSRLKNANQLLSTTYKNKNYSAAKVAASEYKSFVNSLP